MNYICKKLDSKKYILISKIFRAWLWLLMIVGDIEDK